MTRRDFLRIGALGMGGLSLPGLLQLQAQGAVTGRKRAKSVIMITLGGGPSQLDIYDMKPEAPSGYRGEFDPIKTNVPGLDVCEPTSRGVLRSLLHNPRRRTPIVCHYNRSTPMRIQRSHNLGQAAAIQKIDGFLDGLMARPLPAGVKVKHADKSWQGGRMTFAAKFAKGIMGATVTGTVDVTDSEVVMESQVPALIKTFVGEDKVARVINEQFDELFAQA